MERCTIQFHINEQLNKMKICDIDTDWFMRHYYYEALLHFAMISYEDAKRIQGSEARDDGDWL